MPILGRGCRDPESHPTAARVTWPASTHTVQPPQLTAYRRYSSVPVVAGGAARRPASQRRQCAAHTLASPTPLPVLCAALAQLAYAQGVVLVRCPGCNSLHLIADRLGYFTTPDEVALAHGHGHGDARGDAGDPADGAAGGGGSADGGAATATAAADGRQPSRPRRGLDIEAIMAAKGQRVVRGVVGPGALGVGRADGAAAGAEVEAGSSGGVGGGGGGQSQVDGNVYEWTADDLAVLASRDKAAKVAGVSGRGAGGGEVL